MSASVAHRASTHAGRSVRGLGGADPRIQRCAHARRFGQGGLRRTTHPTATRTHRRHAREDAHRQHRGGVAVWCVCSTSKLRRSHSAAYPAQYALHGPLCVPGANAGARSARERHDRIRTDQSGIVSSVQPFRTAAAAAAKNVGRARRLCAHVCRVFLVRTVQGLPRHSSLGRIRSPCIGLGLGHSLDPEPVSHSQGICLHVSPCLRPPPQQVLATQPRGRCVRASTCRAPRRCGGHARML
jgi:hypothetical protein